MKLREMVKNIQNICEALSITTHPEYRTRLGSRIDVALFKNGMPILAVEFESSYKWIAQRVLYNGIKAHAAGFENVLFVYPFQKKFTNKLVQSHLQNLGVRVHFCDKNTYQSIIQELLQDIYKDI